MSDRGWFYVVAIPACVLIYYLLWRLLVVVLILLGIP